MVVNEEGNRLNGIWGFGNNLSRYGIWTFKKKASKPSSCQESDNNKEEIDRLEKELKSSGKLIIYGIDFEENTSEITKNSYLTLTDIEDLLQKNTSLKVKITAHTDNTASEKLSLDLSKKRTESIVNYLVSKGIPKARLSSEGVGSKYPIADNTIWLGRAANRRIELSLN